MIKTKSGVYAQGKLVQDEAICRCNFCERKFKKVITTLTYEIRCPHCGEYDIEILE